MNTKTRITLAAMVAIISTATFSKAELKFNVNNDDHWATYIFSDPNKDGFGKFPQASNQNVDLEGEVMLDVTLDEFRVQGPGNGAAVATILLVSEGASLQLNTNSNATGTPLTATSNSGSSYDFRFETSPRAQALEADVAYDLTQRVTKLEDDMFRLDTILVESDSGEVLRDTTDGNFLTGEAFEFQNAALNTSDLQVRFTNAVEFSFSAQSVPEPSTGMLVLFASAFLRLRRQRGK